MKPFAESCEQNKYPILQVLQEYFSKTAHVLEIGSGTGQHAIFFAEHLPHLTWQTSDQIENITNIQAWIRDFPNKNILPPITLSVTDAWPNKTYDGIFSANTTHIMSWPEVIKLFEGVGKTLEDDGIFCLYGPFNYNKQYSAASNARFDQWLKDQDPAKGIRDFDDLNRLAKENNLIFTEDREMPADNRVLIWKKLSTKH